MEGKEPVETVIHVLPVYIMYVAAVAATLEMLLPHHFTLSLVRIYCLLVLGSWFFHASFILYLPYPLPGLGITGIDRLSSVPCIAQIPLGLSRHVTTRYLAHAKEKSWCDVTRRVALFGQHGATCSSRQALNIHEFIIDSLDSLP